MAEAHLPTNFTAVPLEITPENVWGPGSEAFYSLEDAGSVVVAGLRAVHISRLTTITTQLETNEYHPDEAKRWDSLVSASRQLLSGCAVFQLRDFSTKQTNAYGYVTRTKDQFRGSLPDCDYTLEMCVGQGFQDRAELFCRAMITASMRLYEVRNIGAQVWASQEIIANAYLRAGAEVVASKNATRPTNVAQKRDASGNCMDTRLYLRFPSSFEE